MTKGRTATKWLRVGLQTFFPTWVMLQIDSGITSSNTKVTSGRSQIDHGVETKNELFSASSGRGERTASFPSGLSSAPVKLRFNDSSKSMLDFVAGFFAVEQNPSDLSVSPVISWSVTEPPPKVPVTI